MNSPEPVKLLTLKEGGKMLSETKSRSAGKKLRIGINGFGRIGRNAARIILKDPELTLAAINSRADSESHAYLLGYDSIYGTFAQKIISSSDTLLAGGQKIAVLNYSTPEEIPWKKYNIDIVIDASGKFRTAELLSGHIRNGAKYVVLSAPAKDNLKTLVMGVNHLEFNKNKDFIVSNSSCTTNCLATTVKVLQENFGIKRAFMTTAHSLTDSQNLLDNSHKKEKRLRRSAIASMIPASTGSAKDIIKLFPNLNGKMICQAIRIPTSTVSLITLTAELNKSATKELINAAYLKASQSYLKGILSVAQAELVSVDYKGSIFSAIFDPFLTSVLEKNLINIYAWYDNEWGYTSRLVDLSKFVGKKANIL